LGQSGKKILAKRSKKPPSGKSRKTVGGKSKPRTPKHKDDGQITARWKKSAPAKPEKKQKKSAPKAKKSWRWRLLRWGIAATVIIALIPLTLGAIYRAPSVHPWSTLMIFGKLTGQKMQRQWVPFDKIAPVLVHSVMMSEDGQYCAHNGVDWNAINKIIDDAMEGEKTRGASTITMQSVKNLFLWKNRSYVRKALEIPLALYIDAIWSKRRQMEIYLNIAEWAPGIYGIEAAAKHHFDRSAAKLNRRQAALLAVTLPNPRLRNPKKPSRRMNMLARINRARARQAGAYIRCLKEN
jgi:monofunctional biosynthetic peptidoglycan transglycosylase